MLAAQIAAINNGQKLVGKMPLAPLQMRKVLALPGTLEPDCVYFVSDGSPPNDFELFVTDAAGSVAYTLDAPSHIHTASDVSDFSEAVDDRVAQLLQDATGITWVYDDSLNTLTPSLSGGGGGGQPLDATLTALAALSTSADQMIYSTGADAFSMTGLTSFARSVLDDANALTMRSTLGVGVSDVIQFNSLILSGYVQLPIITITNHLTLNDTHHTVLCNTSGLSINVTLPTAIGKEGRIYRIKKIHASNSVNLLTTSAQTIDSVTSRTISITNETVVVQSDNANWWVV